MKEYKYSTYVGWGFTRREDGKYHPYEECIITKIPANDPCLQFNGENYVSHGGSEGMEFTVHDTLKDAIIRSHYDLGAIKFVNIGAREVTTFLKEILKEDGRNCKISVAITPIITPTYEDK